jgi:hypothetical protein
MVFVVLLYFQTTYTQDEKQDRNGNEGTQKGKHNYSHLHIIEQFVKHSVKLYEINKSSKFTPPNLVTVT